MKWLGRGVKIIDEYNRIPTRTQSALLTVLADNMLEIFDQIYECPDGACISPPMMQVRNVPLLKP
jgi:MoxR-like ATPase